MYFINFDDIDEKTQRQLKKLLEKYYSCEICDDEALRKYIEDTKKEEANTKKTLEIKRF